MKANRITVRGDWNNKGKVCFKVTETIFTGEGIADFIHTITNEGTTDEILWNDEKTLQENKDITFNFFSEKFSKEGFDFMCFIL